MKKNTTTKSLILAGAIAGMIAASTAPAHATDSDSTKVQCYGVNSCKGKTACSSSRNGCSGLNKCKGQGWLPLTKADCLKKKGSLTELKAPAPAKKHKAS